VAEGRRYWMPAATMRKHRVEHSAKHDDADDDANPQADIVDVLYALAHFRHAGAHVESGCEGNMREAP